MAIRKDTNGQHTNYQTLHGTEIERCGSITGDVGSLGEHRELGIVLCSLLGQYSPWIHVDMLIRNGNVRCPGAHWVSHCAISVLSLLYIVLSIYETKIEPLELLINTRHHSLSQYCH